MHDMISQIEPRFYLRNRLFPFLIHCIFMRNFKSPRRDNIVLGSTVSLLESEETVVVGYDAPVFPHQGLTGKASKRITTDYSIE